ncbi:MAG: CCA tRNA nucleotidyltransferase [Acidobacteria bacterium Pan2503]|uniref:CCA tRNA nucleotidyltransferase n=1 Tax=Candidatus Acidiferrum panamense TaxID=2741543 RepID=A0A7V8SWG8_9BACT|nr:CCA tRNA nucleotidyltransferase [Candidatus Acidoferrum panamensis]
MTSRALANAICELLERHQYRALLVGGCVRDLLLGREPADYDVATDATPVEVAGLFPESVAVGAQFGVMLIPKDGLKVEVATFRSDVGYSDGRHPDRVLYSKTPQEDVERRDFTINGLLMRHDTGEVLDFVGGRKDLQGGLVRAIGDPDRRFAEDKLRMMRAVRFAARFGFEIDEATFGSIRRHVSEIQRVSPERLREELTKMLGEGAARRAFELLEETGLLAQVLPEIAAMKGVEQPPEFHPEGDVWIHTRLLLEKLEKGASPTLAWGVLLHDVGKPPTFQSAAETGDRIRFNHHVDVGVRMAQEICRRLRFSGDETEQITALVANHMKFGHVGSMRKATLKRFVRLPKFDEHLELHRLDCLASHGHLDSYQFVERFLDETPPEQVRPRRLLSGDDLLAMGYRPGPQFARILRGLEDAQLEGQIRTEEEAKEYVLRNFGNEPTK